MINFIDVLNEKKLEYKVNSTKIESYELFFVLNKLETVRATSTKSNDVTIYYTNDNHKGNASFSVYENDDLSSLNKKIDETLAKAKLIKNLDYPLAPMEKEFVDSNSNIKDYEPKELGYEIYEAIIEALEEENGKINALEIFINKEITEVKNSNGLDKCAINYVVDVEAIPTHDLKDDSVELYERFKFSEFDKEKIKKEIKSYQHDVKARHEAIKPEGKLEGNVILRIEECKELFSSIAYNMTYRELYAKSNLFSKGEDILKSENGDLITIDMVHDQKGSIYSTTFDSDGTKLLDTRVLDNGVVSNFFGSLKFAHYLNLPATGNLPIVKVKEGEMSKEEMRKDKYLECVSFSGIQIDFYSDYIGGEVRLAYYYDGKKVIPVTGISINAKLSEVLKNIKLSKECELCDSYYGPKEVMLKGVNIF